MASTAISYAFLVWVGFITIVVIRVNFFQGKGR
jgi:hypothetical protein